MNIPKGGMYGAAILSVLIAVSIFLTVASDVEMTEREVTKYKWQADTTGLFEQDESPQYYDYDLTISYTGYYTAGTEPYFGGASAVSTAGQTVYEGMEDTIKPGSVNTYRLNFEPDVAGVANDVHVGTVDSDPPGSSVYSYLVVANYGLDGTETPPSPSLIRSLEWDGFKVQNLVANNIGSGSGLDTVKSEPLYRIDDVGGVQTPVGTIPYYYDYVANLPDDQKFNAEACNFIKIESLIPTNTGSIIISSIDDYVLYNGSGATADYAVAYCELDYYNYLKGQSLTPTWTYSKYVDHSVLETHNCLITAHSCIVNMITQKVDLYAGYTISEGDVPIRTIDLSKACLITNGTTGSSNQYRLGIFQNLTFYDELYVYMDTSKGVKVLSTGE